MKRFFISAFAAAMALTAAAQAVPTHDMYVDFGNTGVIDLVNLFDRGWKPGDPCSIANNAINRNYTDDNFFISRTPLKEKFFRPELQANPNLTDDNAKKLCWWAPIGEMTKKWGPLPRYNFDGDNFNMWQYTDIHGNWSNSWARVPGAFNDVAHKNGVRTGCLYFIDWGASVNETTDAGRPLSMLAAKSGGKYKYAEQFVDFLRYYGITGVGLNPEGTWQYLLVQSFQGFLAECHRVAKEKNWPFHVEWYAFVTDRGALNDGGSCLTDNHKTWLHNAATDQPVTDMYMLNYNWSENGLATSAANAKSMGRDPFDVYAGFDQQGRGYGRSGNAGWSALMRQPISICVWGAHDRSQLYASSTEGGTSDKSIQSEYQTKQELLFSGGNRNVLDRPAIWDGNPTAGSLESFKQWHGYASAVREKSTLYELPFVTRFNLGNGEFLNVDGVTENTHKWYNIGMQDFMPTWRWWIDGGDGKTAAKDAIKMDFTFNDAWFGGSCLEAHGATTRSDVRLFETKWNVSGADDKFSLIYKPATAEQHMQVMVSKEGSATTFKYVDLPADVEPGKWNTATLTASDLGLAKGDVVACVGLSFKDTPANYSTLLGEMSYVPADFNETPATPQITHSNIMKRHYNRADVKLVWDMPAPASRPAEYNGLPVYNEEVGAMYYEILLRQGDGEPRVVSTTTNWAGYVIEAPLDPAEPTMQLGVRAVGRDGHTRSDIAWTEALESPLSIIETLTIDKSIIKPGERFTIGFEDPNHAAVDFKIYNALTDELVASEKGVLAFETELPTTGSYDVEYTYNGEKHMVRSFILVSKEETGRLPEIAEINVPDGIEAGKEATFTAVVNDGATYNGNPCTVSRSLYMSDPFQLTVESNVLQNHKGNSFGLWFKVEKFNHQSLGTLIMTKVDRNYSGTWTEAVWGEMWTAIRPAHYAKKQSGSRRSFDNAENEISISFDGPVAGTANYEHNNDADGVTDGYSLQPNTWYHLMVVKGTTSTDERVYINGKRVLNTRCFGNWGKNWTNAKFYVGGSMTNLASFTGWVDEVQLWDKALSDAEVQRAMQGYAPAEVPAELKGYYTFEEQQADGDGYIYFPNLGKAPKGTDAYMTIQGTSGSKNVDNKSNDFTTALGVPALTGSMPVNFEGALWSFTDGIVKTSDAQSATVTFTAEGEKSLVFTASNSWGTAVMSKSFHVAQGDVVGMDAVVTPAPANDATYDLFGRRANANSNGFFIKNGKKVIK